MIVRSSLVLTALGAAVVAVCLLNLGLGHESAKDISILLPDPSSFVRVPPLKEEGKPVLDLSRSFHQEPHPRPPFETIVEGKWNITGDTSWLLNYAIIGFPKCGTSTLMHHLGTHPEVLGFSDERCELGCNQQAVLIRDLYEELPAGNYARGIKCPADLENTGLAMRNYQKFFPNADFIVGVRHPIIWFESFYNFRVHNGFKMMPIEKLVGRCGKGTYNVCTYRGNFHLFLNNLGKTNTSDPEETMLIPSPYQRTRDVFSSPRKVFLYEVSQLSDQDEARNLELRKDLQAFLHLQTPIEPFIWFKPGKNTTGEVAAERDAKKVDICEDRYADLRKILLNQAINASRWIRDYFLKSDDVFVSSRDHFENVLLATWEHDPCLDRNSESGDNISEDGDLGEESE